VKDLIDYVAGLPFSRRSVVAMVLDVHHRDGSPVKPEFVQAIRDLFSKHTKNIVGLITGHEVRISDDAANKLYHITERMLVARQDITGTRPSIWVNELYGRAIQHLLYSWVEADIVAKVIFIEPDPTFTCATYAWLYDELSPLTTGTDEAVGDQADNEVRVGHVGYEIDFEGNHGDYSQAMRQANEMLGLIKAAKLPTPEVMHAPETITETPR